MVKRKHESNGAATNGSAKKAAISKETNVHDKFRSNLFDKAVLKGYVNEYAESSPYEMYAHEHKCRANNIVVTSTQSSTS